jgi:hypothetical protein
LCGKLLLDRCKNSGNLNGLKFGDYLFYNVERREVFKNEIKLKNSIITEINRIFWIE